MFMSGVATGLFLNWSERADLEDARNLAIDHAITAALGLYAPELVSLYVDDCLPEQIERLLDRALSVVRPFDDTSYVEAYRRALEALLMDKVKVWAPASTPKAS
jgi:hypothetical protein